MRRALIGVVILMACGRSGLELADTVGDDDGDPLGGRGGSQPVGDDGEVGGTQVGGSTATGGVGGSRAGSASGGRGGRPNGGMAGSAGRPEPPLDPGGPIPN